METTIFILVIVIYLLMRTLSYVMDYLEYKAKNKPIPDNVQDVYTEQTYQTYLNYSKAYTKINLIEGVPLFIITLLLLIFNGFGWLANQSHDWFNSPYLSTLSFLGILFLFSLLWHLPFKIYKTFVIEQTYGFNKTTKQTFIKDRIIGLILTIVLGGGIIVLLEFLFIRFDSLFLVVAFVAVMVIFLIINMGYVKVLLPLFNTLTPLEDGELKQKIEALANKHDYTVQNIHVMDASKRSTKLNAFFSGFGKFKNVVLFDTLIDKMDEDAVVAVLAHEIGHAKHKDIIKNVVMSAVQLFIILALLYIVLTQDVFTNAFDVEPIHFGFSIFMFSLLFEPLSLLTSTVSNLLSRKAEYKADHFAKQNVSDEAMVRALKILAKENFATLTPHPLTVFISYSHPPIDQRIHAIKQA